MKKLSYFTLAAVLSLPLVGASQGYKVRAWGIEAPSSLTNVVAINANGWNHCLALNANGTVVEFGPSFLDVPLDLTNVVMVAAGQEHSLALKTDGSVTCWGSNSHGQSDVPGGIFAAIGAGGLHSLGVRPDGTVVVWGRTNEGQLNVPSSATNVVAVTGGHYHSLALRSDGTVVSWGSSYDVPSNLSNVVAIAAGYYHSLALKSDGTVIAWGDSGGPIPDSLAGSAVGISASWAVNIALKADGTVVEWGFQDGYTNAPPDLPFAVAVTAGFHSYAALVTDVAVHPPVISKQPVPTSQTAVAGSTVIYKVSALSVSPLTYQWLFGNSPLPGQTNDTLQLLDLHSTNSGSYSVTVSNSVGGVVSVPVSLNVVTSLKVHLVPRITLAADVGYDYRLEYINAVGPTNNWLLLDILSITNNPQFYYDNTAIGQSQRFYRLATTNAP